MLFIFVLVGLIFLADYIFGYDRVLDFMKRFIVIWLLIAFYAGQYSMRFPKNF